jgi:hypothetical protein
MKTAISPRPFEGGTGALDEALEWLAPYGPDLSNGMTNHAPMAVEALVTMGRAGAVPAWLDRYRAQLLPLPAPHEPIPAASWRGALGQLHRFRDWSELFARELDGAPWQAVLDTWMSNLAPGLCASALHGIIRLGHAVRSLAAGETAPRQRELADALASWAYAYQVLPSAPDAGGRRLRAADAIRHVPLVPADERRFAGTIVSSLVALDDFAPFAPVIALLDVDRDPRLVVAEIGEVFARVYLANAHDFLTTIVFVHGVTSVAALGHVVPHVSAETARTALRYAWQASCALYAAFGSIAVPDADIEPPKEDASTLIDLAVACGDEHAIKLTEACLSLHAQRPHPAYLAAARHAVRVLG